jgi:phage terminase large subunit GpA-like protein
MPNKATAKANSAPKAKPPAKSKALDARKIQLTTLDGIAAQCEALIRPRRDIGIAEWAAQNRTLSSVTASRPGPYDPTITPWMSAIYADLHPDSPHDFVAVMKCQQSGLTELGLSWLAYTLAEDPGPWLVVQPTIVDQKSFVSLRVDDLRKNTPSLPAVLETDNKEMTTFAGAVVRYGNAGSKGSLSSMPVRYVLLDEVSKYPADVQGGGDPVELARGRTTTFRTSRKILAISTPETAGACHMERAYNGGDRRVWRMPCPYCGTVQELQFGRLSVEGYQCEACEQNIDENKHKTWMLERGEWHATNPEGLYPSYHVSGFMRPAQWDGWAAIYGAWATADTPQARKAVYNLHLGIPWQDVEAHALNEGELLLRREVYAAEVPAGAAVLTAGVDVQGDRVELLVYGWGAGYECWLVHRAVIRGRFADRATQDALEVQLLRKFKHERMGPIRIGAACIDTGGHTTQDVYDWCARNKHQPWYAIKGREGADRHIWPPRASRKRRRRGADVDLYIVGVDGAKSAVLDWLAVTEPGPHYMHLPDWTPKQGWADQMLSEAREIKHMARGRLKVNFVLLPGRRNEALDCTVYALAALKSIEANGLTIDAILASQTDLRQAVPAKAAAPVAVSSAVAPPPLPNTTPRAAQPSKVAPPPAKFGAKLGRAWGRR